MRMEKFEQVVCHEHGCDKYILGWCSLVLLRTIKEKVQLYLCVQSTCNLLVCIGSTCSHFFLENAYNQSADYVKKIGRVCGSPVRLRHY
jgi:hypothetical protein